MERLERQENPQLLLALALLSFISPAAEGDPLGHAIFDLYRTDYRL